MKKWLLIGAGTTLAIAGLIAIIMPVLPTTPLLLLAAFCYWRSSPRLYRFLLHQRYLGPYLRDYLEKKGMSPLAKAWTLTLLWISIGCSVAFLTESWMIRIILLVVLVGVTAHIVLIKTIKEEKEKALSGPLPAIYAGLKITAGDREQTD